MRCVEVTSAPFIGVQKELSSRNYAVPRLAYFHTLGGGGFCTFPATTFLYREAGILRESWIGIGQKAAPETGTAIRLNHLGVSATDTETGVGRQHTFRLPQFQSGLLR